MKTILALCAFAVLGACATYRDPAVDAYPKEKSLREERARESAERMRDEFNSLTGDAY